MGRMVDRVFGYALTFVIGFIYFQITLRMPWVALLFALALCTLVSVMLRQLPYHKREMKARRVRRPVQIATRKRAPRCALYGALYMALYLITGSLIYLPLSLALMFLAAMGFRKPEIEPNPS